MRETILLRHTWRHGDTAQWKEKKNMEKPGTMRTGLNKTHRVVSLRMYSRSRFPYKCDASLNGSRKHCVGINPLILAKLFFFAESTRHQHAIGKLHLSAELVERKRHRKNTQTFDYKFRRDVRKPVFGVSDQVQHTLCCTSTEDD